MTSLLNCSRKISLRKSQFQCRSLAYCRFCSVTYDDLVCHLQNKWKTMLLTDCPNITIQIRGQGSGTPVIAHSSTEPKTSVHV